MYLIINQQRIENPIAIIAMFLFALSAVAIGISIVLFVLLPLIGVVISSILALILIIITPIILWLILPVIFLTIITWCFGRFLE